MTSLVVRSGRVLQVVGEVLNRLLLGEDADVRTLLERRHNGVRVLHVQEIVNLLVCLNTQAPEEDHHRNVLAETGDADGERVSEPIELAGHSDLELLGRESKALVQRLHFHRVGMLGRGLLVEEDHETVISNLLLR